MSLLALSPSHSSLSSLAHVLAASSDGRLALVVRRGLVYFTGAGKSRSLMLAAEVVAAAVVDGAAWLVTADAQGHSLHRFSRDALPLGPAIALGELGEDLTVKVSAVAASSAAALVVIEGRRGVLVRAAGQDVEVEELAQARPAKRRAVTVEEELAPGSLGDGSCAAAGLLGEETGEVNLAAVAVEIEALIEARAAELFKALAADSERARLELVGSCQ